MKKLMLYLFLIQFSYAYAATDECMDKLLLMYKNTDSIISNDTTVITKQYYTEIYKNDDLQSKKNHQMRIYGRNVYIEDELTDVFQNDTLSVVVYHGNKSIYINREKKPLYDFNNTKRMIELLENYYSINECRSIVKDGDSVRYISAVRNDSVLNKEVPNQYSFLLSEPTNEMLYSELIYTEKNTDNIISVKSYYIRKTSEFRLKLADSIQVLSQTFLDQSKLLDLYKEYKIYDMNKPIRTNSENKND